MSSRGLVCSVTDSHILHSLVRWPAVWTDEWDSRGTGLQANGCDKSHALFCTSVFYSISAASVCVCLKGYLILYYIRIWQRCGHHATKLYRTCHLFVCSEAWVLCLTHSCFICLCSQRRSSRVTSLTGGHQMVSDWHMPPSMTLWCPRWRYPCSQTHCIPADRSTATLK